jgi:hypothetical protein
MWKLVETEEYGRRFKRYAKDHPRELQAVLDNLDTYFQSLLGGIKPLQIRHGFLHPEPQGAAAIDQKGGGKNLAQTRLYVFPDPGTETLHMITLGDKRSQKADIATCRAFVDDLRKEKEKADEEENSAQ